MAVTSLNAIPVSNPALALKRVGACHYLDHPTPIDRWHGRVPFLVYPALVGAETLTDLAKAKPEDRKNTLIRDGLTLGLPALGTIAATRLLMKPESEILPTTQAALRYIANHYPQVIEAAQSAARQTIDRQPALLNGALWGKHWQTHAGQPLAQRLAQSPHQLLDVEVGQIIRHLREASRQPVTPQRLNTLIQTSEAVVLERVKQAGVPATIVEQGYEATRRWAHDSGTELPQFDWPQRLREQLAKTGWLAEDAKIPQSAGRQFLLKNELRLLLPFGEAFDIPANIRTHSLPDALKQTLISTGKDLKDEAGPFFLTGLAAIASGVGGGLLANKVLDGPKAKNRDIVNEGVFQFVANVCMCAIGATAGMGTANLLGLTKFNQPLARLAAIVGGLVGGITLGAASANTISEKWLGPAVDKALGIDEPATTSRRINANDMVLHLDDLPTALAIAGVQIFKPWISPFFYISAKKAAQGYRNGDLHLPPCDGKPLKETPAMIQPTTQGPATLMPSLATAQRGEVKPPYAFTYPGTLAVASANQPQVSGIGGVEQQAGSPAPDSFLMKPAAMGLSPLNRLPSADQQPADLQTAGGDDGHLPDSGPHQSDALSYSTHALDPSMQAVTVAQKPGLSVSV